MPNHVTHKAEFFGDQNDVDFILSILKTEENNNGEQWTRHIDFNNIVPQPKSLFLESIGKKEEERTRGWNWYDWNRENWGTKWNAYSIERDGNTITFDTAWNSPSPVMKKLHELCVKYQVICEITYADEDCRYNTGHYLLGGAEFELIEYENESPQAYEAYRITHPDWNECHVMNEDGTMSYKEDDND